LIAWIVSIKYDSIYRDSKMNLSSKNLKTLVGLNIPQKVGGHFFCTNNQLTSLEGAPQEVGGDFSCAQNQLTSLEGAPQEVGGDFFCSHNQITSLEGAPQEVGGDFYCYNNQITSLEGAPQKVGGDFSCAQNQLTSLEGAPQEVGGMVHIEYKGKIINSIDQLREELMVEREFRGTGFEDVFDL
jgi:hypothetical protein